MGSEKERGYDLRNANFDQFVDFFFNPPNTDWMTRFSWEERYDPAQCVEYYIRLFREPEILLDRYTQAQLEQAFWAIPSGNFAVTVTALLWEESVDLKRREECIRAMYYLYKHLFSIQPLSHACWMWWDLVVGEYEVNLSQEDHPERKGEVSDRLKDAMFETLCRILTLPSLECQAGALHGLNHLQHPDTESVLRRFLQEHPELDDEARNFVEGCVRGEHP